MNFDSHLSGVVTAACSLVNVATPGQRQGRLYTPPTGRDLARSIGDALRSGSRPTADPAPRRLPAFTDLAARLRPVFEHADNGSIDAAAASVNRLLTRYAPTPSLTRHDGEPWHLHFHGPGEHDVSGWGGGVVVALATVIGSEHGDRLGVCSAPACDRVFVDVSRNGTRRFCSTSCQNRVKAAAHRARQRA